MNKKLFMFDIDGTLLSSRQTVLDSTIEAIKNLREKGHEVCIATGRTLFHAQDIIDDLEFNHYIVSNGAAGFLEGEQVYKKTLDSEELSRFVYRMEDFEIDTAVQNLYGMKRLTSYNIEKMQNTMFDFTEPLPALAENFHKNNEVYQGLAFYDAAMGENFEKEFNKFNFIRWHENSVDVIPKDSSKAVTMLKFAEKFDVSIENVFAIGDGLNDKEMLQTAGVGIAMGNAHPEVKRSADFLTKSNDENGIWHALKELHIL